MWVERRRDEAQPAHGLDADGDPEEGRAAVELLPLADGEQRRHDHRAGMDRAAFEGVVEILAVNRGAVDERGRGRRKCGGVADGRARPLVVAAGERDLDVILVARGDGETDDVDQKLRAFLPHRRGQPRGIERADLLRQMLGNGGFGQRVGNHGHVFLAIEGGDGMSPQIPARSSIC